MCFLVLLDNRIQLLMRVNTAVPASDCGCAGRLLPGPNRITWLSGVLYLTGMGPEKHRTYTKHLTLLCLFLHAGDYCSLTYGGKNDDRDPRNEIVENPCVRLSSVPPLQ